VFRRLVSSIVGPCGTGIATGSGTGRGTGMGTGYSRNACAGEFWAGRMHTPALTRRSLVGFTICGGDEPGSNEVRAAQLAGPGGQLQKPKVLEALLTPRPVLVIWCADSLQDAQRGRSVLLVFFTLLGRRNDVADLVELVLKLFIFTFQFFDSVKKLAFCRHWSGHWVLLLPELVWSAFVGLS
jgi:hypothetical protein